HRDADARLRAEVPRRVHRSRQARRAQRQLGRVDLADGGGAAMSGFGIALFLFCGLAAVLSAVGTISVKSPIRAAMSLLVHIVALSGLFLTLHAHLLAALQLLVYAGAVVVLFVFVIMMIGPAAPDPTTTRGLVVKAMAASLMAIVTLAFTAAVAVFAPARGV